MLTGGLDYLQKLHTFHNRGNAIEFMLESSYFGMHEMSSIKTTHKLLKRSILFASFVIILSSQTSNGVTKCLIFTGSLIYKFLLENLDLVFSGSS